MPRRCARGVKWWLEEEAQRVGGAEKMRGSQQRATPGTYPTLYPNNDPGTS